MARSETAKMFTMMGAMVILWADVFAYYVLWLMMTYLTNVWKISFTSAAAIINLWTGASAMLPVIMAHIADAFVGNFTILLVSTLSYCAGLGLLTMSTPPMLASHFGTCSEYKPECIGDEHKRLFFIGLGLISVGAAGHMSSLLAFASDQLDEEDRGLNIQPISSCNFQCWGMFLGALAIVLVPMAGIIVIPYVKPWSVRYGIAAIFSVVSLVIFLLGCCWYTYVGPQGSPYTTIMRVFVASSTKLFCRRAWNEDQLYEKIDPDDEQLPHTNGFCFLDLAAVVLKTKPLEQQETNRWRLCTVTEVEGTKIFLRMIPMWLTFIACGLVSSIGNTYFLEQANHMNPKLGRLHVPLIVLLAIYDKANSFSSKLYSQLGGGENPSRYAPPLGIAVSMVFAILCCVIASRVEARRLDVIMSHGLIDKPEERIPMSIFWLVPQFVLLGWLDGMYENSINCFFNDQVGPSMRRYMSIFSNAVMGFGAAGSAISVYVVGKVSERGGKRNWFQHTINESRLDRYYRVLATLSAVNLMVFIVVAWLYKYRESRSEGMEARDDDDMDGVDVRYCC